MTFCDDDDDDDDIHTDMPREIQSRILCRNKYKSFGVVV